MPDTYNRRPWGERLISSPWRVLLFPLWLLYRPAIVLRNLFYDRGWKKAQRLDQAVISVGNIIAGGSGKTPLVAWLVEALREDYNCHVLSRGYKGDGEQNEEASLVHAPVHCDPKRWRSGRAAIAAGATLLILDDGFQHRQLHRDCDIVLIDASRPWGNAAGKRGATLPLGFLREHPRSLKRSDIIILSRSDQIGSSQLDALHRQIQRFGKPVLHAHHQPQHLCCGTDMLALDTLDGQAVICVSGIAHPQAFESTAAGLGYQIAASLHYADHHHFSAADVNEIDSMARKHQAVVLCTSKDAVKLQPLWSDRNTTLYVLEISLSFSDDDAAILLNTINSCLDTRA